MGLTVVIVGLFIYIYIFFSNAHIIFYAKSHLWQTILPSKLCKNLSVYYAVYKIGGFFFN